jgi:hypothetical protein
MEINPGRLQGLFTDQLPHSGLDTVEATQDLHGPLDASSFPTCHRLQFRQHLIEAGAQIGEHMIRVAGKAMPGIKSGSGATHQDRFRQNPLQAGGG